MQLFCRHTWGTSQLQLSTTHPYLPSSKCCWIPCSSAGRAATHGFKLPMNTECNVQHPEPEYPLCQFSQRLKNKPTSCFIKKKYKAAALLNNESNKPTAISSILASTSAVPLTASSSDSSTLC